MLFNKDYDEETIRMIVSYIDYCDLLGELSYDEFLSQTMTSLKTKNYDFIYSEIIDPLANMETDSSNEMLEIIKQIINDDI